MNFLDNTRRFTVGTIGKAVTGRGMDVESTRPSRDGVNVEATARLKDKRTKVNPEGTSRKKPKGADTNVEEPSEFRAEDNDVNVEQTDPHEDRDAEGIYGDADSTVKFVLHPADALEILKALGGDTRGATADNIGARIAKRGALLRAIRKTAN